MPYPDVKAAFFSKPSRTAVIVSTCGLFTVFIPMMCMLVPLIKTRNNAQEERDGAQAEYDKTAGELNNIRAKIVDAEARVVDLGCALAGYEDFNKAAAKVSQVLTNANGTALDKLKVLWGITLIEDKTTNQESKEDLTYRTTRKVGMITSRRTHHYQQITTIVNNFKGIAQGDALTIPTPLECGKYARRFKLFPQDYMLSESPHTTTGERSSGVVNIRFTREYGSKINVVNVVDNQVVNVPILVPRNVPQEEAATTVTTSLQQYYSAFLALCSMLGGNYASSRQEYNNSLPGYNVQQEAINRMLTANSRVLTSTQTVFDNANGNLNTGLAIWIPLLITIPLALGLITYFSLVHYNKTHPDDDRELGVSAENQQPIQAQDDFEDAFTEGYTDSSDAEEESYTP